MIVTSFKMKFTFWILSISILFWNVSADEYKCERITLPMCLDIEYNKTIFPNNMGHSTQNDASFDLNKLMPLVEMGCSAYLKIFLCSVYVPLCSDYNQPFPPCRQLCEQARSGCEQLISNYDFIWPDKLNCDEFPEQSPDVLCFGPQHINDDLQINSACKQNAGFTCPPHMQIPQHSDLDYSLMGVEKCSASCDANRLLFWENDQQSFARLWVGCWSFLCLISTLFTVLTYLIDMPRFLYPERPIIFLSGCYLMVSIAYIAGFFLRDDVACKELPNIDCNLRSDSSSCPKVVTQGTRDAGCTVLFMIVYFFSMASSIWWVMLTVTWFLAAGLKWGHEAIEQKSPFFHVVAWCLPALQTIAVLISSHIEGDILSGVCFVGLYSTSHLLWTLLLPLSIYMLTGTGFLVAGFIAMFNIRNVVKHEAGTNRVEKLEKLMVKIGIFSVLYTVPATVTIACYYYEYANREAWMKGWFSRNCQYDRVPCPCEYKQYEDTKPDFILFIVKYFMTLIVGITSGFWIWSSKTVESWVYFRDQICCKTRRRDYQRGAITASAKPMNALYVQDTAQCTLYQPS